MKKPILFFVCALLGLCVNAQSAGKYFTMPSDAVANVDYAPSTVIFKLKPEFRSAVSEISSRKRSIAATKLNNVFETLQVSQVQQLYPHSHANVQAEKFTPGVPAVDLTLIHEIKIGPNQSLEEAINNVYAAGLVEYAEPKMIAHLQGFAINDPKQDKVYALTVMKMFEAWDVEQGDTNVVIGMVDSGVNFKHEDLKDNYKRNWAEIKNDSIDNDGDGYVDNWRGWDFGKADTCNGTQQCGGDSPNARGTHGTHTTGCAAAKTNNGVGIGSPAGINCMYMCVQANDTGANLGAILYGYEGITYAVDHGATIINCSWGRQGGSFMQSEQDVCTYATQAGCLVLTSCGNWNSTVQDWPSGYRYVISVAGTDQSDKKYSGSAYGLMVDLSAPGTSIYSTGAGCTSGSTTYNDTCYYTFNGTSEAVAYVSGCAALVKSHFPYYNGLQVGEQLKLTTDNIDALNPSFAGMLGTGRCNCFRAVTETPSQVSMPVIDTVDNNNNQFVAGDTLFIDGKITNFLDTAHNLYVKISSTSGNLMPIADSVWIGTLNTWDTLNVYQFRVRVVGTVTAGNYPLTLAFISDDGISYQNFTVHLEASVAVPELNLVRGVLHSYPNPAHETVTIAFNLLENSHVELLITDVEGRLMKTIVDSELRAGNHLYDLNVSNFSQGIYFYTLKTDSYSETKRLIVLEK